MRFKMTTTLACTLLGVADLALAETNTLAWQQPGYVMEEVVVTASRSKVADEPTRLHRLVRRHTLSAHAHPLVRSWALVRRVDQLNTRLNASAIAP